MNQTQAYVMICLINLIFY